MGQRVQHIVNLESNGFATAFITHHQNGIYGSVVDEINALTKILNNSKKTNSQAEMFELRQNVLNKIGKEDELIWTDDLLSDQDNLDCDYLESHYNYKFGILGLKGLPIGMLNRFDNNNGFVFSNINLDTKTYSTSALIGTEDMDLMSYLSYNKLQDLGIDYYPHAYITLEEWLKNHKQDISKVKSKMDLYNWKYEDLDFSNLLIVGNFSSKPKKDLFLTNTFSYDELSEVRLSKFYDDDNIIHLKDTKLYFVNTLKSKIEKYNKCRKDLYYIMQNQKDDYEL